MSDPFFAPLKKKKKAEKGKRSELPEGIDDEDEGIVRGKRAKVSSEAEDFHLPVSTGPVTENSDERRLRAAKAYLEGVREELGPEAEDDEVERRLRSDAIAAGGRSQKSIASRIALPIRDQGAGEPPIHKSKESATSIAVTEDGRFVLVSSKVRQVFSLPFS